MDRGSSKWGSSTCRAPTPVPAFSVASVRFAWDGLARAAVRGATAGVTVPKLVGWAAGGVGGIPTLGPRASDHGPLVLAL